MVHYALPSIDAGPRGSPKQADPKGSPGDPDRTTKHCSSGNSIFFSETTGKYYYPRHETPYLLVANFRSAGHYILNNRRVSVSDNYFYLLNAGDRLEIDFREVLPLQTFLVLFGQSFIEDIFHFLSSSADQLLGNKKIVGWLGTRIGLSRNRDHQGRDDICNTWAWSRRR